jgi:hypothetical protein
VRRTLRGTVPGPYGTAIMGATVFWIDQRNLVPEGETSRDDIFRNITYRKESRDA